MSTASASSPSARAAEMREQRRKKWLAVRIAVADFTVRSPARLTALKS